MVNTRQSRRRRLVSTVLALMVALVPAAGCASPGRFAGYDLPPEERQYTLTVEHENIVTSWQFTSGEVVEDERPDDHLCPEEMHAIWLDEVPPPCRPETLIFLRYDAGVDINNAVPAGGHGTILVTAFWQAPDPPSLAGLTLSISTDDGASWEPVRVRHRQGTDSYLAMVTYPPLADTAGAVSVRTEAWDVAGNRVTQTIDRAWFLD